MSLIIPANSAAAGGGFNATNSLMFNRADSAYLVHTNSGTGSYQKSTFSAWVKRSSLGTVQTMWNNQVKAGVNQLRFEFDAADKIYLYGEEAGGYALRALTTSVYRDLSAWYHVLVIIDTPQSAAADRIKLYVNGVQVTLTFSTTPAQNANLRINYDNTPVSVGSTQASNYLDGYMAEVYWIDATVYATSDFGEFDEDSGIWKPIDASGLTFGTNGFYLDFEDSSALGNDAAGSNNFSATNIAATDQGIDTCTNNFATLNPLVQGTSNNARTFSDGNTTVVLGRDSASVSSIGVSSGKWYVEIKCVTDAANPVIGIAEEGSPATVNPYGGSNLVGVKEYGYVSDGNKKGNAGSFTSYGATWTTGNTISMAYDADTGTLWFAKDGAWQASATKTEIENGTTTNSAFTGLSGLFFFGCCDAATPTGDKFSCNFGSPYFAISSGNTDGDGFGNFEYEVPSGYFALCTKNLAEYG